MRSPSGSGPGAGAARGGSSTPRRLAPDLWVVERPLRYHGLEIGARMTVLRFDGGDLLLHSPVAIDAELRRALDALGRVRYAVAPNRMHHLFIGEVSAAWPEVRLYAAPGLEAKRADVAWHAVLGDRAPAEWRGQLEHVFFGGFPQVAEVDFFHPPSRTLLLSDVAFHVGAESPPLTRLAFRLLGAYGRLAPTLLERRQIRDRAAARASLERILAWDFDRVIVAHGGVLETGGRAALRLGYDWLL